MKQSPEKMNMILLLLVIVTIYLIVDFCMRRNENKTVVEEGVPRWFWWILGGLVFSIIMVAAVAGAWNRNRN